MNWQRKTMTKACQEKSATGRQGDHRVMIGIDDRVMSKTMTE
jgi:hypothetical protein